MNTPKDRWLSQLLAVLTVCTISVLASCAPKLEQTPVSPIAPTVRKPAPVQPVDIKPVIDRSRQVEESNRQLSGELSKNKAIVFDLRRQLQAASVAAVVTPEQWERLKSRAEELETSRTELETINADQQAALVLLADAVTNTSLQVQIVQGSLDESQAALDDANLNIAALNTVNQNVQKERDLAVKAFAESSGTISELRKSRTKWVWAFGVSTVLLIGASYLALKP